MIITSEQSSGIKFQALILEDDLGCAEIVANVIEAEGGEATICATIQSAKEAIEAHDFDVLVLDHRLPDGTGSSFYYYAREQGLFATAIMLTGIPELSTAIELTRNGLFNYLTKPFELKDFLRCLRQAILRLSQPEEDVSFVDFVARSSSMREVRRLIQQAAENPHTTVLLTGETGVGKDVVARLIHQLTVQNRKPAPALVSLNCSTLPAEMFEAELFGAERGSYTGAHQQRTGLAEAAHGGTLFLDEIGEVPLSLQPKLLQFLEVREYRRLGSTETKLFLGRIIAATNRSLDKEVEEGRFRADLWYRLDVFSIFVPPLRERKEDLGALTDVLLGKLSQKYQRQKPILKPDDFVAMEQYDFPGNVRELRNVLERSLLQTQADSHWLELDRAWLRKIRQTGELAGRVGAVAGAVSLPPERVLSSLEAQEYALIRKTLAEENGIIRRAAARLGLSHQSLLRRLEKWPELRQINSA